MQSRQTTRPSLDQVWDWLHEVLDPEVPVVSVIDLGIVRDVRWVGEEMVVTITPTYSGCPAMQAIAEEITRVLAGHGITRVRLETRLSPAWSTDWLSDKGREQLRRYGIAPPAQKVVDICGIRRGTQQAAAVACPHCGSNNTRMTSAFGSTACKALYKCDDCLEPFDYFKPH